jgi:hypothetical protein
MPSDTHIGGFRNFVEPTNVTELLRFLGCVQFFANHIDHCADKAAPLYEVLVGTAWNMKNGKKSVLTFPDWHERSGSEQKYSFAVLKDIMSAPEFLVPRRADVRQKWSHTHPSTVSELFCCKTKLLTDGFHWDLRAAR